MERDEKMGTDGENMQSRRKFLKTAGKFAIYTPPALMVMSTADATKMAKSGGPIYDKPWKNKKRPTKKKAKRKVRRKVVKRRRYSS